jgi:hypothetical protein
MTHDFDLEITIKGTIKNFCSGVYDAKESNEIVQSFLDAEGILDAFVGCVENETVELVNYKLMEKENE